MEIKLPFIERVPEFEPRKRPGINPKLNVFEREVLDVIDVMEQKQDWTMRTTARGNNLALAAIVLVCFVAAVDAPRLLAWFQARVGLAEPTMGVTDNRPKK